MAGLMMVPTQDGLNLLKEDLKANLKEAVLLDENKDEIKRYEFYTIYYDNSGVLTALFEVGVGENLTTPMKYLRVVNGDGAVISEGETPEITFVTGVGGVQTLKFALSGEAGEVVFKEHDYISSAEFNDIYLHTLEALSARVNQLENILIRERILHG